MYVCMMTATAVAHLSDAPVVCKDALLHGGQQEGHGGLGVVVNKDAACTQGVGDEDGVWGRTQSRAHRGLQPVDLTGILLSWPSCRLEQVGHMHVRVNIQKTCVERVHQQGPPACNAASRTPSLSSDRPSRMEGRTRCRWQAGGDDRHLDTSLGACMSLLYEGKGGCSHYDRTATAACATAS